MTLTRERARERSPRPPSTERSVTELLAGAGEGDPDAWEEIVRRYGDLVRVKVRSYRLQHADALDAAQATWLRLAENRHRIRDPERLGGWLTTTVHHECLRILRQSKRTSFATEEMTENLVDPSDHPDQHVVDADTAARLWSLVAELSPRRRDLLEALFIDDRLPYSQVARMIEMPPGSIGPTRARALRDLQRMAGERGLGPPV